MFKKEVAIRARLTPHTFKQRFVAVCFKLPMAWNALSLLEKYLAAEPMLRLELIILFKNPVAFKRHRSRYPL